MAKLHFTRERVRVDAIVFDAGTQVRAAINEQVVTEYAERMTEGVEFPPVVLFSDGVRYYLADGFHRTLAAKRNEFHDIEADVTVGTRADALWYACEALAEAGRQGLRPTHADTRRAIEMAINAFEAYSDPVIAKQIGCSDSTVWRVRQQVLQKKNLPSRVTGKDGKNYPASRNSTKVERPAVAKMDKSRTGVQQRREQMREMAAGGYNSTQIASTLGITEQGCRTTMRKDGIDVPADRVIGKSRRLDPNRIVGQIAMDADNLTINAGLIDFAGLDRSRLGEWVIAMKLAHKAFGAFIRRLEQEGKKDVEAA